MRISSAASVNQQFLDGTRWAATHLAVAILAWLLLVHPAHAQVCEDELASSSSGSSSSSTSSSGSSSSTSDRFSLKCDMSYKNTEIMCDKYTVYPSCPPEPMPMKATPKKSLIKDFSPYLWTYARDPDDTSRPYVGEYAIGTPGDPQRAQQMAGTPAKGLNPEKACQNRLKFPSDPKTPEEEAKMKRMEVDNCANEFILDSALYPYQKANPTALSGENKQNAAERISLGAHCQPLKTVIDNRNEYLASDYLKAAWMKTLQNPGYRKTPGASKEPHLPSGVQITEKVSWCGDDGNDTSCPFPEVRTSSIGAIKTEEINDPTHPFSPRWDFRNNERDEFSPLTAGYQDPTENAVYCAGVKDSEDSEEGEDSKPGDSKADQMVKVDILEFRRPAFQEGMNFRIGFNTYCYNDPTEFTGTWIAVIAASHCWEIIEYPAYSNGFQGVGKAHKCWECYGHDSGQKVDDEDEFPPCTTRYDGDDQKMINDYKPGARNLMQKKALCALKKEYKIQTLCRDLRAPYAPLNKLKMRYHNPKEKDKIVLKEGVQDGFWHKSYFGNHMPYPRLWDTGSSIQDTSKTGEGKSSSSAKPNNQRPKDVYGQYTAIVGIGHEATASGDEDEGEDSESADSSEESGDGSEDDRQAKADKLKKQDLRCLYGGWGEDQSFGGVSVKREDPITSWTEVKLYQTLTRRRLKLSCIGRYEKLFKPGGIENQLLARLGAGYARGIISTPDAEGRYTHQSLADKKEADEESGDTATDTDDENKDKRIITQIKNEAWPLAWRGYLSTKKESQRFPNFGDGSPALKTGLDNVEVNDIIILDKGGVGESSGEEGKSTKPGLPALAIVVRTNLPKDGCNDKKDCSVFVEEFNNGKWPDACGDTDTWGQRKERTYYKPGMLPANATAEFERIKTSPGCENVSLNTCEMGPWDKVKFYRASDDVREGTADEQDDEEGTP